MTTELAIFRYIQALAPAKLLLFLSIFWARWRVINDVDDYVRMIHIQALIGGLAILGKLGESAAK